MDVLVHSFVVRIWIEETAEETGRTLWRGDVTHAASKKRQRLSDLGQIAPFIKSYLKEIDDIRGPGDAGGRE